MGNAFHQIKDRFNKDAKVFEDIYHKEVGFNSWFNRTFRKPIFERFEITMEQLGPNLQGKRVLDIGCGPGAYIISIAARKPDHVLGIDLSEVMLDFARRRVQAKTLETMCELKNINFLEATFERKFNFSIAMGVFDYLSDPLPFLKKMKEVSSEKVIASFPGYSILRGPLRQLRYLFTRKGGVFFYHKQDIEQLAEKAGFKHYDIIPLQTGSGFILVGLC